jgi:hypothetical protein
MLISTAAARLIDIVMLRTEPMRDGFIVMENEKPMDLTGVGLEFTILPYWDAPVAIARLTTGDFTVRVNADEAPIGLASFYVPLDLLAYWPSGNFVYTLRRTAPGATREICRGKWTILPGGPFDFQSLGLGAAITLKRSEIFDRQFQVLDRGGLTDITGEALQMRVKPAYAHPATVTNWSTANAKLSIVNGPAGIVRVQDTFAAVAALTDGVFVYQVFRSPSAAPVEMARGGFIVTA